MEVQQFPFTMFKSTDVMCLLYKTHIFIPTYNTAGADGASLVPKNGPEVVSEIARKEWGFGFGFIGHTV